MSKRIYEIEISGDIPAHDVWNQSRSDQIDRNNRFTQLILKYFPGIGYESLSV